MPKIEEGNVIGWGVLGFFIPIAGFILYFVWKNNKPKAAKYAGLGALISFVIGFISTIITLVTIM